MEQFEDALGEAVELTLATLWNDDRYVQVADSEHDIRVTATVQVPPFFPPAVFYAWPIDSETVELVAFEFELPDQTSRPHRIRAPTFAAVVLGHAHWS